MAEMLNFPGDPKVIAVYQEALVFEAHLNLQYRMDQRQLKFMGLKPIAKKMHKFGDDAHRWQGSVTKHLMFLGADAAYKIPEITNQATLTAILSDALDLEMATVKPYEEGIEICRVAMDDASRNGLEHYRKWHNVHISWLMTNLNLIKMVGEDDYITTKI
jgi:bacterioferritin (cytochrome b1)